MIDQVNLKYIITPIYKRMDILESGCVYDCHESNWDTVSTSLGMCHSLRLSPEGCSYNCITNKHTLN